MFKLDFRLALQGLGLTMEKEDTTERKTHRKIKRIKKPRGVFAAMVQFILSDRRTEGFMIMSAIVNLKSLSSSRWIRKNFRSARLRIAL
jgi:hypothetical protein